MTHYEMVLEITDKRVDYLLRNQVRSANSSDLGGIRTEEYDITQPKFSIYALKTFSSAYFNSDSSYFMNEELLESMLMLLDYIERVQRGDGTFDLLGVNFVSPPDTAFMAQRLATAYRLADKYGVDEQADLMKRRLYEIIKKAGQGMSVGGFHTPNHRWAIASALLMAYNIVGEESFKEAALKYLSEGIDCDEDGEWTERSSGGYNVVCNNCFMIISEELQQWDYLDPVRRNLELMYYYMEPDGSIYTTNSTRQDSAAHLYPTNYYHLYKYMAYRDKDGRFAYMANRLISQFYKASQDVAKSIVYSPESDFLYIFMFNPELKDFDINEEPLPTEYSKEFKNSGLVRVRKGDVSYSISENSDRFLTMMVGDLRFEMKITSTFFAIGHFNIGRRDDRWNRESVAFPIQKTDKGYQIRYEAHATYFLPFEESPSTPFYDDMDHSKRGTGTEVDHSVTVSIRELDEGLEVGIKTAGCDQVPFLIEFNVTPNSLVRGEGFLLKGKPGESIVITTGFATVKKNGYGISVGPACGDESSSLPIRYQGSKENFNLCFSDVTNVDHIFTLKPVTS